MCFCRSREGGIQLLNRLVLRLASKYSDTLIHRAPFLVAHRHPPCDLVEGAQTTAAHLIAQHRRAVAHAGRFGGDFGVKGLELRLHGARLYRHTAKKSEANARVICSEMSTQDDGLVAELLKPQFCRMVKIRLI
jgi:hypothetical protein